MLDWKILLTLAVLLALAAWAGPMLLRRVSPWQAPAGRELSGWGTLDEATATRLQAALDAEVNRLGVPGLQAAVRTAEGGTWYGVSGTTDPERRFPLRRDHLIRVGSVTKTFIAVLSLQLAEEGRLSLDDPLAKWFPDFPGASGITLRHLLTLRSGIPDILRNPGVLGSFFFSQKAWQPLEMVEVAAQEKLTAAPGERYEYSNTNYILLGLVAERVTGQSTAALLRERILTPLDLRQTFFVPYETAPALHNLISGYDRDLIPLPGLFELKPESVSVATAAHASGALVSTADDLAHFYAGLFGGRLLSAGALDAMTTFLEAADPGTPQQTGYGLGLFRWQVDGETVWAAQGEFIGSMAAAAYAPGDRQIVTVVGNLSLFDYVSVWQNLTAIIRRH